MRKKTYMFYINSLRTGGAERVILQLAHHFYLAGNRSILVTSFVDTGFEYSIPEGIERISIENQEIKQNRLKRNISRISALRKLCKKYKPDALISFMAEPNLRAVIATLGLPVKSIISVRNDPEKEYSGKLFYFVGKYLLPLADGCVFQTKDAKAWFPKKLQKKSAVIMNEVSLSFFNTKYFGGNNVVTLGRLTQQKNQSMLIEAFSQIADEFPNLKLEIYGEGDLRKTLEEKIISLNMCDRIKLMGATKNVSSVLSTTKCFVLCSDYEGMPNALMEALAVGVPSIATDCPCGGPKMLIESGVNGILIPVGDVKKLAEAMKHILLDSDYATKLGINAKESANNYLPDVIFRQWEEFINGVVDL